jgi:hypothetical protein
MLKFSWALLAGLLAAFLFMAPGPVETSCNPAVIFSNASNNATGLGGVNAKREVAWFAAASSSNATGYYLKFYDGNVAPTVGTTVPAATFAVPGALSSAGNVGAPTVAPGLPFAMQFLTGLWVQPTAGPTTADTNTVANNVAVITVCWL